MDEQISDIEWDLFVAAHWTDQEEASLLLIMLNS